MADYIVRPAHEDDLTDLIALRLALQAHLEASNPHIYRMSAEGRARAESQLRELLQSDEALLLVAETAAGRLVGMVTGEAKQYPHLEPTLIATIGMMYVAPEWREQGVGTALVTKMLAFFREKGADEISLRYVIGNGEAERFWTGLGFEPRIITAGTSRVSLSALLRRRGHAQKGGNMLDTIFARRSIRQYTDEPVTPEQIKKLLEAGMAAPSAANRKPWHFVVVTDKAKLNELAERHPHGKMLAQAAAAIVVCGDPQISERFWVHDCAAATENILLAITALGLGGVWLGVYPGDNREAAIQEVLGIPKEINVLSMIALGHPAEQKEPRTQYDETRVHRNGW